MVDRDLEIDIEGVDKVLLLRLLHESARSFPRSARRAFNEQEARTAVTQYIHYFCGCLIACDISGDKARHTWRYDWYVGEGSFEATVAIAREMMPTYHEAPPLWLIDELDCVNIPAATATATAAPATATAATATAAIATDTAAPAPAPTTTKSLGETSYVGGPPRLGGTSRR
ncbi:uncharacterized protein BO72DRAFT_491213 [Aspergillus fijiensis CBS 313.89]|uniref:Uncharacterized protein n=1 Tax=Aspergillus fijiensis CBS 313.89 TaxID=1448319 RepID=A0A8G1S108_9EURO|nr:uncharacterized protein BO72DRAFT_491213 [Aspergillus fijiensis CBS 313.89]RAK82723.1 hypothetical protein BO72DRAFT_491213 [Aspergillus fijiensis CBS 313.89]